MTDTTNVTPMDMGIINKLVLTGLLLSGAVFLTSKVLGFEESFIYLVSYFLGCVLVVYSIAAFLWIGLLYLVQGKHGLLKTLYPLNGMIAIMGCILLLFVL